MPGFCAFQNPAGNFSLDKFSRYGLRSCGSDTVAWGLTLSLGEESVDAFQQVGYAANCRSEFLADVFDCIGRGSNGSLNGAQGLADQDQFWKRSFWSHRRNLQSEDSYHIESEKRTINHRIEFSDNRRQPGGLLLKLRYLDLRYP